MGRNSYHHLPPALIEARLVALQRGERSRDGATRVSSAGRIHESS